MDACINVVQMSAFNAHLVSVNACTDACIATLMQASDARMHARIDASIDASIDVSIDASITGSIDACIAWVRALNDYESTCMLT